MFCTFEKIIERGQGGWRFGLPANQLVRWTELPAIANISRDRVRALEQNGRKAGADPAQWFASLVPVNIERCLVEYLVGDRWCSAQASTGSQLGGDVA
jgi:hypothetical protein